MLLVPGLCPYWQTAERLFKPVCPLQPGKERTETDQGSVRAELVPVSSYIGYRFFSLEKLSGDGASSVQSEVEHKALAVSWLVLQALRNGN